MQINGRCSAAGFPSLDHCGFPLCWWWEHGRQIKIAAWPQACSKTGVSVTASLILKGSFYFYYMCRLQTTCLTQCCSSLSHMITPVVLFFQATPCNTQSVCNPVVVCVCVCVCRGFPLASGWYLDAGWRWSSGAPFPRSAPRSPWLPTHHTARGWHHRWHTLPPQAGVHGECRQTWAAQTLFPTLVGFLSLSHCLGI